jgi:hypothetical protein
MGVAGLFTWHSGGSTLRPKWQALPFGLLRLVVVSFSQFYEPRSGWIIYCKPAGNSQTDSRHFFRAGLIHDNADLGARKKHLIR